MNLTTFRTHIKQRLGFPAVNIEITNDQLDILVADTLEKFIEVHYDGLDEGYIFLDLVKGTIAYAIPDNVHSVLEVLGMSMSLSLGEPLLITPYTFTDISVTSRNIVDTTLFRQSYSMYQDEMAQIVRFEFNSTTHELNLIEIPTRASRVALKVHYSPTSLELLYENKWIQKYSTALVKYQWGQNLSKYAGGMLPGGVTLNYDLIMTEAKEAIEKLELELYEIYQEPIDFAIA